MRHVLGVPFGLKLSLRLVYCQGQAIEWRQTNVRRQVYSMCTVMNILQPILHKYKIQAPPPPPNQAQFARKDPFFISKKLCVV